MAVYLISYDLKKEPRANWQTSYKPLWDAIKKFDWAKPMESFWFISVPNTNSEALFYHLSEYLDSNDYLFVSELAPHYHGCFDKDVHLWLKSRLV